MLCTLCPIPLLLLLLYNEFCTGYSPPRNGCSEIVQKSLSHKEQSDRKWRMDARLKPCSGVKTSASVMWPPGGKEIYAYSSSTMWPSRCGGKRLKRFCHEKFVVYKSDLGECGGSSCIFLKTFGLICGSGTDKGPGEGGSKRGNARTWKFNKHDHECHPTDSLKLIQHLHTVYDPSLQKGSRENKICTRISRFIQSVLCSAPTELLRKFHPNNASLI